MTSSTLNQRAELASLIDAIQQSGLLTEAELQRLIVRIPDECSSSGELSEWLVDRKFLSRFQAHRLLEGKPEGLVLGQYHILEPIGISLTGRCFLARHRTMNRLVVIKAISSKVVNSAEKLERYQKSMQATARLSHPNISSVWDINQIGNRHYVIREFVPGEVGHVWLNRKRRLSIETAKDLAVQLARALHAATSKGVYHGAVNPSNLYMSTPQDAISQHSVSLKLANFGICGLIGPSASIDLNVVKDCNPWDYLAPELFSPIYRPTLTGDAYGFGCTLYQLFTGQVPFPGGSLEGKASSHKSALPTDPRHIRIDMPPEVADLIMNLLSKDPSQRPTDFRKAANLLANSSQAIPMSGIIRVPNANPSANRNNDQAAIFDSSLGQLSTLDDIAQTMGNSTSTWSDILDDSDSFGTTMEMAKVTKLETRAVDSQPSPKQAESGGYGLLVAAMAGVTSAVAMVGNWLLG